MNRLCSFWKSRKVQELRIGETPVMMQDKNLSINRGMIHVWSARYSTLDRYYPLLSGLISPAEMLNAAGFKKPSDTRRYILRHGLVREILGQYTNKDPANISFVYGRSGKPDINPEGTFPDLRFSFSRTEEMVCIGITLKSEIGLDIVKIQPRYSFSAISNYLFTPDERRWIGHVVPDQRPFRFFRIWSLKEALLKATGGDVQTMKETDVSPVMTDAFLDGFYTMNLGETDQKCFIHESGCGVGHHGALAAITKTT
jgi:4'-phosphopantetheinyl transferase